MDTGSHDPLHLDLGGSDFDPPVIPGDGWPRPERPRRPRRDDWGAMSWGIVGSVGVMGMLKLAFLLSAGWIATMLSAVLFIAAHGLFIAVGATWFWDHRHEKDW